MATLTAQKITGSGLAVTYTAADAAGDKAPCGPQSFLHVRNGGAGSITVTIDSVAPCSQGFDHDLAVPVAAGGESMIGPLPVARFAGEDRLATVTYSAVTGVTVAALTV